MLLLARKAGESVVIDGNIRITVGRIGRRVVQLKVEAPREIRVDREEVWKRRVCENQSSADGSMRHGPSSPCEASRTRRLCLALALAFVPTFALGAGPSDKAPGNSKASADVAVTSGSTSPMRAQNAGLSSTAPDAWRYRWNDGRWWYWMPEQKWMMWTGSAWVPYDQFSGSSSSSRSSTIPYRTGYRTYANASTDTAPSNRSYYNAGGYGGRSTNSSRGDYAGYGWNWGPGTVFPNGSPRR